MISFNKEQIFIVTGASSGLGEGVALLLNELGATVVAVARNLERLNAMRAKCKFPENMHIEIKDLAEDIEALPQYVKDLKNKYGKFTGLAYCAGIVDIQPLQILDYGNMQKLFNIDYYAPLFLSKGFGDRRNNVGRGASVVFISSIAAISTDRGMATYAGAKAALISSAKVMARELASQGIRVNCVSPSDIITPMIKETEDTRTIETFYPLGAGQVSDVANMVVFLLSDKAHWLSRQNYIVDCGCI